jgi:hypothetical protein
VQHAVALDGDARPAGRARPVARVRASAPGWLGWLLPIGAYLVLLLVLVVVACESFSTASSSHVRTPPPFAGSSVLSGLARYDGGWYRLIARWGYRFHAPGRESPVAFFPGYPLGMRSLGAIVGDQAIAGMLLTATSGLGSAVAFWRWCRARMAARGAATALLLLLVYPYAYYLYGLIYADATFLLVTLLAFWAVERDRPLAAAVLGAVATFTRPVGIAVVVGLVVRTLERRGALARPGWLGVPTRLRRGSLRWRDGLVVLSATGLAAYMWFLWHRFGDPLLFSEVERYWGHTPEPRTWLKADLVGYVTRHGETFYVRNMLIQGALAIGALLLVPRIGRRFGWGYAAYVLVVVGIPAVATNNFQGLGRYMLAAFPVVALVGEALSRRALPARAVLLGASALALVWMMSGFARGLYLS